MERKFLDMRRDQVETGWSYMGMELGDSTFYGSKIREPLSGYNKVIFQQQTVYGIC
jgi:hypothetical protein